MQGTRNDIRFKHPTLNNISFITNKNFEPENFKGFNNLSVNLEIRVPEPEINDDKEEYLVTLDVKIGEQNNYYPFEINISYMAVFEWDGQSDIEKDDFLNINAPAILYSYCRPVISNITGLSEFPPLDLPFYNFTNKKTLDK